ncbi:hypothetical protein EYC80_008321 [Monilinia laxa]|uniref:Adenylate kinase active site lid domain-containing protein n=1 Tax=Monilinia laxa TaxID=61186 RepID=A0A5N6JPW3_MONLA|nr:hypothetical protein EYC80_008321 [Monilinia laxa]
MATQHPKIIFVLGPPGTGKGTQCALLEQSPPRAPRQHTATKTKTITIHHLSIGDMLRAELDTPTSKWGATIRANMAEGRTGPPEMSVAMLKGAMERKRLEMGTGGAEGEVLFLVDDEPKSTHHHQHKTQQVYITTTYLCIQDLHPRLELISYHHAR